MRAFLQIGIGPALAGAFCLLAGAGAEARADRVTLRNGQVLEGLAMPPEAGILRLKIGVGEIRLPEDSVLRIERADPETLRRQWEADHFDHPDIRPESCRDLAVELRNVEGARAEAATAAGRHEANRNAGPELERELAALQAEADPVRAEIARRGEAGFNAMKSGEVDEYNRLVARSNDLANRIAQLRTRRASLPAERTKDRQAISDYLLRVERFAERLEEERQVRARGGSPEEQRFVALAIRKVSGWQDEIFRTPIPHEDHNGHALIPVRLNDRLDVSLLLDTGASLVSLSAETARKLGLVGEESGQIRIRLADGRTLDAPAVRLSSVQAGDARVENVDAVILPDRPAPDVDGLLGASFLREFVVRYDASAGRLELMRLRSGPASPPPGTPVPGD